MEIFPFKEVLFCGVRIKAFHDNWFKVFLNFVRYAHRKLELNETLFTNNIIISTHRHFWKVEKVREKEKHARRQYSMSQGFKNAKLSFQRSRSGVKKKTTATTALHLPEVFIDCIDYVTFSLSLFFPVRNISCSSRL